MKILFSVPVFLISGCRDKTEARVDNQVGNAENHVEARAGTTGYPEVATTPGGTSPVLSATRKAVSQVPTPTVGVIPETYTSPQATSTDYPSTAPGHVGTSSLVNTYPSVAPVGSSAPSESITEVPTALTSSFPVISQTVDAGTGYDGVASVPVERPPLATAGNALARAINEMVHDVRGLTSDLDTAISDASVNGLGTYSDDVDLWRQFGWNLLVWSANRRPDLAFYVFKMISLFSLHAPHVVSNPAFAQTLYVAGFCRDHADDISNRLITLHLKSWSPR